MSGQAGRYTRSSAGMVGAMIVSLAVIVGFVVFRDLNRSEAESPVRAVEYEQAASHAGGQASFEILAPAELPRGWRATSVRFTPSPEHWHLGLLTGQDRYVGIEQGTASVRTMVQTYVDRDAVAGKPVTVAGQRWQSWSDDGGDVALVRDEGEVTTLVVGTVDREVLVDFVESLN